MDLIWAQEENPTWDDAKGRIIGAAPPGAFEISYAADESLPGDWFVATDPTGKPVGYGWLDATWGGDAEILLAVDPSLQHSGAGSFILAELEHEAARRGLNYVYNTIRETHPDREVLHDWLSIRGYKGSSTDTALRKHVEVSAPAPRVDKAPVRPDTTAVPPGHEDNGGYVDVDAHQY